MGNNVPNITLLKRGYKSSPTDISEMVMWNQSPKFGTSPGNSIGKTTFNGLQKTINQWKVITIGYNWMKPSIEKCHWKPWNPWGGAQDIQASIFSWLSDSPKAPAASWTTWSPSRSTGGLAQNRTWGEHFGEVVEGGAPLSHRWVIIPITSNNYRNYYRYITYQS